MHVVGKLVKFVLILMHCQFVDFLPLRTILKISCGY